MLLWINRRIKEMNIKISLQTQLSNYIDYDEVKINKILGEGSFGIVYLGKYRNNKVAIKKIKDGSNMEEIDKEIEMMSKFKNEYLIYFYGSINHKGSLSMVLEYAPYGSFSDLITQKDLKMNLRVMKDIINGIYYLHSNGIIHRDLKPDNVLIVNNNINAEICGKLTDFGSSRVISMIQTNRTFTNGIGTPLYMSPEILEGRKYSLPSDIFSFAVIMYEASIVKLKAKVVTTIPTLFKTAYKPQNKTDNLFLC